MGRYSVHLVGESNYQAPIASLSPGDPVAIIHEPENPYDPRALRVADVTGSTIGYIERGSWLTRALIDDGLAVSATVEQIIGGTPKKPALGVVLMVSTAADAQPSPAPAGRVESSAPAAAAEAPAASSRPVPRAAVAKTAGGGGTVLGVTLAVVFGLGALGVLIDQLGGKTGDKAQPSAPATPDAAAVKEAEDRKAGFHCLSSWDGSHRELVRALKRSLRDPDSFEHVETRISPVNAKGFHTLSMQYRARNGFGGMNLGRLIATVKNSDCSAEIVSNESS